MGKLLDNIELRVPSKAEYVSIVRAFVTDLARRLGLSPSAIEDVQVAVSEACANVVRHAYSEDEHESEVIVLCSVRDGRLLMEIADCGQGFCEPLIEPRSTMDRDGGFGLVLIRNLMDNVSLDSSPEGGTVVRMSKKTARSRIRRSRIHGAL